MDSNRDLYKFRFESPCTVALVGPTCSGKTNLMFQILECRRDMFKETVTNIYWFYNAYQETYKCWEKEVTFYSGLTQLNTVVESNKKHSLLILDDLLEALNSDVSKLFTQKAHHCNISVFFLSQNLFPKHPVARTVSLNTHYIVVFKNKRDSLSISTLARQMFPRQTGDFLKIYKANTQPLFSYLLINFHPRCIGSLPTIHAGILPHNIERIYYLET
jgi:hypothetical protein